MGYNLKYKGAKIDELLDKAATALQEHQDISGKQDVITDLATIRSNAAKGATALQSVPSEYITETELTDKGYATISAMNTELGKKQDTITDLATIRSGAAKGATALQSHQDISGKLDKTAAASTYLSKTDAASTYLGKTSKAADATKADSATKATQDASGNVITTTYATKTELNNGLAGKVSTVSGKGLSTNDYTTTEKNKLAGIAAGAEVNVQSNWTETDTSSDAYIKNKPSLATVATSGSYTDLKDKPTIPDSLSDLSADSTHRTVTDTEKAAWNAKSNFSGSYNDLSDKPTIPSAVTESTVSGWGFTKNTGTYSKPSTGIPKTDLASAVQTSLGKADSALQSYTETDPVFKASAAAGITSSDISNWNSKTSNTGTITGIKMNGASKGTSGVVDLGTVITSHQDISGKQDKLVSGTSIKTVNGTTLLGSGNVSVPNTYSAVNHGTSDTTFTLTPNVFHVWGSVSALTLTLGTEISGLENEYLFQFTSGTTATTLSLPSSIKWVGGNAPTIEINTTYQISIVNNLGVIGVFPA